MRARGLKPGFFKNEDLGSADPLIQLLFAGLWCMADREGRLEDRPLRISAEVFPYRRTVTERDVDGWLDWLQERQFVLRYTIGQKRYIQVVAFKEHQSPHVREAPSKIPEVAPNSHGARTGEPPVQHRERTVPVRSDSLTPDSLTADYPCLRTERARAHERTQAELQELLDRCRHAYPPGVWPASDWLLADRYLQARLEEGVPPGELVAGCERYAAQCVARECGTRWVRSPKDFFTLPEARWREAYPLPTGGAPRRKTFADYFPATGRDDEPVTA